MAYRRCSIPSKLRRRRRSVTIRMLPPRCRGARGSGGLRRLPLQQVLVLSVIRRNSYSSLYAPSPSEAGPASLPRRFANSTESSCIERSDGSPYRRVPTTGTRNRSAVWRPEGEEVTEERGPLRVQEAGSRAWRRFSSGSIRAFVLRRVPGAPPGSCCGCRA